MRNSLSGLENSGRWQMWFRDFIGASVLAIVLFFVLASGCMLDSIPLADQDGDGYEAGEDCDDQDPSVGPAYTDTDQDGFGVGDPDAGCGAPDPSGYALADGDCDDASAARYPGAVERCDGLDNDCDGLSDDEDPDRSGATVWYVDVDLDGYGDTAVGVDACAAPDGYVADGSDCDDDDPLINPGTVWYCDADNDGYGSSRVSLIACEQPSGYVRTDGDCDDSLAQSNPGEVEVCDGTDNDCDGVIDGSDSDDASTWYVDGDNDGFGDPSSPLVSCSAPDGYVAEGSDCDDSDAGFNPSTDEICDGADNDCDGVADEEAIDIATWYRDQDGDGHGDPAAPLFSCVAPGGYVDRADDCDDVSALVYPGAEELCDTLDNDCDEEIDEVLPEQGEVWFADADWDRFGDETRTTGPCGDVSRFRGDCDDQDPARYPGAMDPDGDGVDQDCGGTEGTDPHVGLSAGSMKTLKSALEAAVDGQTLWVGPGTYYERNLTFGGKAIALRSTGFAAATLIDVDADESEQGQGVIFNSGETESSVLDGFTIKNAYLALDDTNGDGGCIYVYGSSPTILNCVITGCLAQGRGGGIFASMTAMRISNTTISDNKASSGGGMYMVNSTAKISDSTISGNRSMQDGSGAGISLESGGQGSAPVIERCLVSENLSESDMGSFGGGIFVSLGTQTAGINVAISHCRISGNAASNGGGLAIFSGTVALSNCELSNNIGTWLGGAIYIDNGLDTVITNSRIMDNKTLNWMPMFSGGGGMYVYNSINHDVRLENSVFSGNATVGPGGGMLVRQSNLAVRYSVFSGNRADRNGGGIAIQYSGSTLDISTSVLAYNTGYNLYGLYEEEEEESVTTVECSDLFAPDGSANHNLLSLGDTNFTVEPQFYGYDTEGYPSDFHLSGSSALVDIDCPGYDIDFSPPDPGVFGGILGASWDRDDDSYPDYFWPGGIANSPDPVAFPPSSYDCDDSDPGVHLCP